MPLISERDTERFKLAIAAVSEGKEAKICFWTLEQKDELVTKNRRKESNVTLLGYNKNDTTIRGLTQELENVNYCSKCNTKYNVFQFLENKTSENTDIEQSFETIQVELTKITWKSIKSVMVVAKSLREERNSLVVLESQTADVAIMIQELLDKIESNHKIETKMDIDTTYSNKMLQLSNRLYNKFSIIKNFFHIENNSLKIENNVFNLKSAIIYTIDLCSMSMHTNSHISLDFEEWLPSEIRGDKVIMQQILSSLMDLALQMTDTGEISLKSTLDGLQQKEHKYLIAFSIKFTPTSTHAKEIISLLVSSGNIMQKEQLVLDLKKRAMGSMNSKNFGIPHLQIGLVRDVIYRIISFMQGNYRVYTQGEKVIFEIKLPVNQGPIMLHSNNPDNEFSISPYRQVDQSNVLFSKIHIGGSIKYSRSTRQLAQAKKAPLAKQCNFIDSNLV